MKNILSIAWYRFLPPAYGGQKGIAFFNQYLGRKVPLSCLCPGKNLPAETLSYTLLTKLPASRYQFWNPFIRRNIRSFISHHSFTDIIIEHPYHGWLGKYKKTNGFRFIIHAHNIEHLRMKARQKRGWRLVKKTEQKAFERADLILFKTEKDQQMASAIFGIDTVKTLIIPYGTPLSAQPTPVQTTRDRLLREYNIDPGEKILLFAGTPGYEPNEEALEIILNRLLPLLMQKGFRFRLFVCGNFSPGKLKDHPAASLVIAAGYVTAIEDYLQSADVFINPVISGSGIQTKNIEAIANGCNIVTTAFASTGLPSYLFNSKVFISDDGDWEHFADNIITAAENPVSVPEEFYTDYNWEQIIDRFLLYLPA